MYEGIRHARANRVITFGEIFIKQGSNSETQVILEILALIL